MAPGGCPVSPPYAGAAVLSGAMTNEADGPPAAPAAVPEARSGWSEQDRRALYITIGGTLTANVATVILVGAALAVVRTGSSYNLGVGLLFTILGSLFLAVGVRISRKGEWFGSETGPGVGWMLIGAASLLLLIAVLIVVGAADRVK